MPRLSVVVLTWNEADNIGGCLAALAAQRDRGFEAIVVDAASTDGTPERVRAAAAAFPVPLRLHAAPRRLPIGAARNLGVAMAAAPVVAFLSADAEPDPAWTGRALAGTAHAGMLFGRQVHAPRRWGVGAAVRGLRYHFPLRPVRDPLRYASNVGAAYRREVLLAFPFEAQANAAEDLLLARRAAAAGHRAAYDPAFTVRHHDVAGAAAELRKCRREGFAWGLHHRELGVFWPLLGWGAALGAALALAAVRPLAAAILAPLVLWLPALRRAVRRRRAMPARALLLGVAASPLFDLAFLLSHLGGLAVAAAGAAAPRPRPTEARP